MRKMCATCTYFAQDKGEARLLGLCHRYPPTGTTSGPVFVTHTHWCGEHQEPVPEKCPRCYNGGMHPHCPLCGLLCRRCMHHAAPIVPLPGCTNVAEELRPPGA